MNHANPWKAGYSLVEVTLALLVVAIGLTSTFALFPEAMKNTRSAVSDTEVALFADYVFSTLAVEAAVDGESSSVDKADTYSSLVLSEDHRKEKRLKQTGEGGALAQFYWIPEHDDQGTGDWEITRKADYWSTAFSYRLTFQKREKRDRGRCTYYAMLEVWPGEWKSIADENAFKPYVFYREILPYPKL